jgi:large-conductance mechanosensitive channel
MKVLLPYLIGAAFTFVVQDLVQVYVVPRVQTRRQREDRWVKDVRDLGELLFPLKL